MTFTNPYKRRITVTRSFFEYICKEFAANGYASLGAYEKEILEASDHDGLNIIEAPVNPDEEWK
jgi:hypothetical protein